MVVFMHVKKEMLDKIKLYGFYTVPIKSQTELARFQGKTTTIILFNSGKLLLQGPPIAVQKDADIIRSLNIGQEQAAPKFKQMIGIVIGSDEVLKGDSFGGIVVAAVKANDEQRQQLINLGVADSKLLTDDEIAILAPKIEKIAEFEIKNIFPEEYNEFKGTITQLLNKLHKECYYYLKPGEHIVDKYPGCAVGNIAETKAESKYVEVAAASILARFYALKQLEQLSAKAGFSIPKGSTHVEQALFELKRYKLSPEEFVKLNFRNVRKILGL